MTEDMYRRQENPEPSHRQNALVIGCGGVGAMSAITMACTGAFSNLFLVDGDEFEHSNFNRLPIPLEYKGWNKAEAVADYIEELRPSVNCTVWPHYMESEDDAEKIKYGTSYQKILFAADGLDTNQFMREHFSRYIESNRVLFVGTDGSEMTIRTEPVEWGTGESDGYENVSIYNILQSARCIADLMVKGFNRFGHQDFNELQDDTFTFSLLKAVKRKQHVEGVRDHYEDKYHDVRSEFNEVQEENRELRKKLAIAEGNENDYIRADTGSSMSFTPEERRSKTMREFAIQSNNTEGVVNVS